MNTYIMKNKTFSRFLNVSQAIYYRYDKRMIKVLNFTFSFIKVAQSVLALL